MHIYHKTHQFELFPTQSDPNGDALRPRYFSTHFTFSLENMVVMGILMLMTLLFLYSIGLEKGKRIVEILPNPEQPVPAEKELTDRETATSSAELQQNKRTESPVEASHPNVKEIPAVLPPLKSPQSNELVYTIQVASFRSQKYAQLEVDRLKDQGYDRKVIMVVPKGEYSIVCVGQFSRKEQANTYISRLRGKYKDCLVRRL